MKVLVTGATGFIGRRLVDAIAKEGRSVRVFCRSPIGVGMYEGVVGDVFDQEALRAACSGVDCVFHCAGYAHAFAAVGDDEAWLQWDVNVVGTKNLINAAAAQGVRHFVFLSSVKAMGEPGQSCVDEHFAAPPESDYGKAKLAAEKAVLDAAARHGMHVVNLRLCMVYGAGGRGNLERMGRMVRRGLFPPLPETGNRRSLVHVDDVVDAMMLVAEDERAAGKTYIIAGPDAPSGHELYQAMRSILGMKPAWWVVPQSVLRVGGRMGDMGKRVLQRRLPVDSEVIGRLLDSAWYSALHIEEELGWKARISLKDGLSEMFGV